ncbi:MAG: DUF58 domain-containing protein [Cellulosilyticaceae bacterium]
MNRGKWKRYSQVFMMLIASVGALYLIDATFGVAIIVMLVISVVLSFVIPYFFRRALHIAIQMDTYHLEKREILQGKIVVQNLRMLPTPWFDIKLYTPLNMVLKGKSIKRLMLAPKEALVIPFCYEGINRGVSMVGVESATLQHLFGLMEVGIEITKELVEKEVTIMPEIYNIDPNHPMIRACETCEGEETVEGKEMGYRVSTEIGFQCRPYETGDALNKIHWKQSAKHNQWMVRENLYQSLSKQHLILDPRAASWMREEERVTKESELIEDFLSMANALYSSGIEVVCYFFGNKGWEAHLIEDRQAILSLQFQLARYQYIEMVGDIENRLAGAKKLMGEGQKVVEPMIFTLSKEVHDEK